MTRVSTLQPPPGWTVDILLLEDYAETSFDGHRYGLSGPYEALMFHGSIAGTILVECGGGEANDKNGPRVFVLWHVVPDEVTQIISPANLPDILAALRDERKFALNPALEVKSLIMHDSDTEERYLPPLTGWSRVEDDGSTGEPLEGFNGQIYSLVEPHQPFLRTIQEDVFIIITAEEWIYKRLDGSTKSQSNPLIVLWDKSTQVIKRFRRPSSDPYEIAHFMFKEQKQFGKTVWSDQYFTFEVMEPKSPTIVGTP